MGNSVYDHLGFSDGDVAAVEIWEAEIRHALDQMIEEFRGIVGAGEEMTPYIMTMGLMGAMEQAPEKFLSMMCVFGEAIFRLAFPRAEPPVI